MIYFFETEFIYNFIQYNTENNQKTRKQI